MAGSFRLAQRAQQIDQAGFLTRGLYIIVCMMAPRRLPKLAIEIPPSRSRQTPIGGHLAGTIIGGADCAAVSPQNTQRPVEGCQVLGDLVHFLLQTRTVGAFVVVFVQVLDRFDGGADFDVDMALEGAYQNLIVGHHPPIVLHAV